MQQAHMVARTKSLSFAEIEEQLQDQGYTRYVAEYVHVGLLMRAAMWGRTAEDAWAMFEAEHHTKPTYYYTIPTDNQMIGELDYLPEVVGTCPECDSLVFEDDPDGPVWTCPRDLDPSNKYWMPSDITEEQMEESGCYSQCYEDHGGYCGDHMPLHSACYAGYFTVVPAAE